MRILFKTQNGDTIIEVLIAIVIVSLVLGGAYLSSNQSLTSTRQSEERGEALKYAEGQLERLKTVAAASPGSYFGALTNVFCIDTASNSKVDATQPTIGINSLPILNSDPFNYVAACTKGVYHLGNEYDSSLNVYKIHVRWDRAGGNGRDELVLNYRINN